jgi:hypothetical protein
MQHTQDSNPLDLKCNGTCVDKGYFTGYYNSSQCWCLFMMDQRMIAKPISINDGG